MMDWMLKGSLIVTHPLFRESAAVLALFFSGPVMFLFWSDLAALLVAYFSAKKKKEKPINVKHQKQLATR